MIARLPLLESIDAPDAQDARAREVAALQAAWAELDEAHRLLTEIGAPGGSLAERLRSALAETRQLRAVAGHDLLDSLVGCALTTRQLCEDTGRPYCTVYAALMSLRALRLVRRERRGTVYVYRATALGRQALRGGR